MQRTFTDEIKYQFKTGNLLTKLILLNVGVFLIMAILMLVMYLNNTPKNFIADNILEVFAPNGMIRHNLTHPWSPFIYMFLHLSFWHLLIQMVLLYFTGQLYLQHLDEKKLLNTYIFGGLAGFIFYFAAMNLFPVFEGKQMYYLHGASAATMALLVAVTFHLPRLEVMFFGVFPIKLIIVALLFIMLDLVAIPNDNRGARIAHLGGALYGIWASGFFKKPSFILNRFDLTDLFSPARWFRKSSKLKVKHSNNKRPISDEVYNDRKAATQKRVDDILDKINRSGYESLTKEEKEFLFNSHKNV
ncbi:MAG: rhomboid family intramembrane serine protease [Flavobacteriales bacterium]|nr:rhomboid family intramembrane serine protease [Flavobacteriales bacterium]